MQRIPELDRLNEQIFKHNRHLSDRIDAVENRVNSEIFSGEGLAELNRINSEISRTVKEAKRIQVEYKERALAAQRPPLMGTAYEPGSWMAPSTKAFIKALRRGGDMGALTNEERSYIDFNRINYDQFSPEVKVMVSAAADLGGFFAGTDFSDKFIQKLFLISPLRAYADTQTIGGEKLLIPSEGSTDTNIFWSDEQTGFQASPDPNLGMLEIFARELNGYIKLSKQNLEDSVFDVEAYILKRLTRQFAQKEGTAFINGDGVARPEGIITNANQAGTGINILTGGDASTHTILPMDCINLMHSVKSGYRATGTWLASNATIGALRLFRDSQKRPLWTMFGQDWMETLFGRPIIEMPDMVNPASYQTDAAGGQAVFATGNMPLIFGDIGQGYQIVDRVGLTFQTLKELFAIQNQVAYLARVRVGGKVVLPEAIAVLKLQ